MRNLKISADISEEANKLLNDLVGKHERSKGWLIDKMIKKFCSTDEAQPEEKSVMQTAKRSPAKKAATYPSNLDEQFEMLWDIKGKKGAKNGTRGAYAIFKKLAAGVDDETCEAFTKMLIDDIVSCKYEVGYPEMHLTTYLNQQRWEK